MPLSSTIKRKAAGSYTEYQIMYWKENEDTVRLYYVTAESAMNAIKQFRLSHITEEIISVVKL